MNRPTNDAGRATLYQAYHLIDCIAEKVEPEIEMALQGVKALLEKADAEYDALPFACGEEAPPLVPHHPHDRVVGAMKGEA